MTHSKKRSNLQPIITEPRPELAPPRRSRSPENMLTIGFRSREIRSGEGVVVVVVVLVVVVVRGVVVVRLVVAVRPKKVISIQHITHAQSCSLRIG